jgi:hypothetical protein
MNDTGSHVSQGSSIGRKPAAGAPGNDPAPSRRRSQPLAAPLGPPPATQTAPQAASAETAEQGNSSRTRRLIALATAPFAVSLLLHVIVLLAMALVVAVKALQEQPPVAITASVMDDEPVDALESLEIEPLPEQEMEQPVVDAAVDPGEISIGDVATAGDVSADISASDLAGIAGDIGSLDGMDFGTGMGGDGDGAGTAAMTSFFGAKSSGRSFVFVVDNSNSMIGGRLETAFQELLKAIDALGPKQQFYVVFFSDSAYGLFYPDPASALVPATPENKQKLRAWLDTVEMCDGTNGEEAVKKALELQPDVICILGDGEFRDDAASLLTDPESDRPVINTFGMQIGARGEINFEKIAQANRGKFHLVDVSAAGRQLAKQKPIKDNKKRGPVWGKTLPAK